MKYDIFEFNHIDSLLSEEKVKTECTEISSKGWPQSKDKPAFIFTLYGDFSEFSKFSGFIFQNTARFWKYLRKSISRSRWPKNTRINWKKYLSLRRVRVSRRGYIFGN